MLQLDSEGKEKSVHHNILKPYEGVNTPMWILKARKQLTGCKSLE